VKDRAADPLASLAERAVAHPDDAEHPMLPEAGERDLDVDQAGLDAEERRAHAACECDHAADSHVAASRSPNRRSIASAKRPGTQGTIPQIESLRSNAFPP